MIRIQSIIVLSGLAVIALLTGCNQALPVDTSYSVHRDHTPILKYKDHNPILQIQVVHSGHEPAQLSEITLSFGGNATSDDVAGIQAWYMGSSDRWGLTEEAIAVGSAHSFAKIQTITGEQMLDLDTSYFMITCDLTEDADLQHGLEVQCQGIKVNQYNLSSSPPDQSHFIQRFGVSVRKHLDDHVDTYRIPGLVTTKAGSLLAIYDVRREKSRDLQGDIDIGVSRSTDRGNTWEPMRIALDRGTWGGLPEKFNGISDACILVDDKAGTIYVAGLWMYGVLDADGRWVEGLTEDSTAWAHQWKGRASQPGFDVKETSQFLLTHSDDDGLTWSEPVNLTALCKKEEWWLWAPAPGHGITLDDGTLVFPSQGRDKNGEPFSNITYSQDQGKTWKTSNPAYSNTTENMAVQLSDGSIMLNMRYNPNRSNLGEDNGRVICITDDLGKTWKEHPTSRHALIEPTCMASIHKHPYQVYGMTSEMLFFSNPNSKQGRTHMTLKASLDDGNTWPEKYWFLLDENKGRGYSCITSIDEQTIGILYEGSQADMTFEQIPVIELLHRGDRNAEGCRIRMRIGGETPSLYSDGPPARKKTTG